MVASGFSEERQKSNLSNIHRLLYEELAQLYSLLSYSKLLG